MVHRKDTESAFFYNLRLERNKSMISPGHLCPGDAPEARDDQRLDQGQFSREMGSAGRDLVTIGIAIAAARVARITSHQVGDKDAVESGASYHQAQQLTGAIAAEWSSRTIAAEPARR
jgi:hypothetical protein